MKKSLTAIIVSISLILCGCSSLTENPSDDSVNTSMPELSVADTSDMDFSLTDRDRENGYDAETAVTLNDTYEITVGGTFVLSGEITDKTVKISAGENDKVQLVLDNATIANQNGPAIFIQSADKVFITAKEGTVNRISDGSDYSLTDGDTELDGAIFSRADLTLNGNGELTVNGNYKHEIVSKDDLVIASGNLTVNAKNVGLNGKDCVKMADCNVKITAGSDAVRSDNTEDPSRGYVYIESGRLDLTAGNDGIQAETVVKIGEAEISVVSGGGSSGSLSQSDESFKGIKAGSDILISGGEITVSSRDDCIHSNNTVSITGGSFDLSSGDDGIHADTDLSISNGEITVNKSYEGIEASRILISGGSISVCASDDGINAAGGNDGSAMGGRPGMGGFSNGVGEVLISGGYLLVDAMGDGLDSNGTFAITGGIVLVSGPTNNGNGAFDYEKSALVTGGVLIALGSAGMAQGFSSAENQGAIFTTFNSQSGGTSFAVCDSNGTVIASFTPAKAYQSATVTAPEIQSGNTYTFVVGGTVSDADENGFAQNADVSGGLQVAGIEMTSNLYSSGGGFGGGGFGGGGFGGGGGGKPGGDKRPPR